MDGLSPQGALLMLCVSRLPERMMPRHAWAAEVLVEQLWADADEIRNGGLRMLLSPLIGNHGVDERRIRAEVWELAQAGALVPAGIGAAARFEVSEEFSEADVSALLNPEQQCVVDFAVDQLTARLLAFSKTASAC
ncbi:hypothetical protein ACWCOZ_18785 [Streptomyces sp. NPDC001840]